MLRKAQACVLALLALLGCSDGQTTLEGGVQKGPFVLGSSVTVSPADGLGNATGQSFHTSTTNDLGDFWVVLGSSGLVSLEGNGFYYNEATGQLSGAQMTLRGFYQVSSSGGQQAYLNLVTHLSYARVASLLAMGTAYSAAVTQAEQELREALAIVPTSFDPDVPGVEMNILGGDSDANAYLLAMSAVLAQAAVLKGGPIDATLQELLNNISQDLAVDGQIDP